MAGQVLVNGQPATKAGTLVAEDVEIQSRQQPRYVSRGGLKLERAFAAFSLNATGRVVLDAGASTGGFTDCLLKHGARKVIAVDVGYGQLHWRLRQDPRVEVVERTNVRYLECDKLSEKPSLATLDLSFISLKKVLPAVVKCLSPGYEIVALVKPQFEAGKDKVGKGGVVHKLSVQRQVLLGMWDFVTAMGLQVRGLVKSPLRGPKGNIEYLMYLVDGSSPQAKEAANDISLRDKEKAIEAALKESL